MNLLVFSVAETSVKTMKCNFGCLSKIKVNIDGEALALLTELEEYIRSAAEQMRAVEELEAVMSQKEAALKVLHASLRSR
jgi:hypothetical protein